MKGLSFGSRPGGVTYSKNLLCVWTDDTRTKEIVVRNLKKKESLGTYLLEHSLKGYRSGLYSRHHLHLNFVRAELFLKISMNLSFPDVNLSSEDSANEYENSDADDESDEELSTMIRAATMTLYGTD